MSSSTPVAASEAFGSYITVADAAIALAVDHKTIRRKITAGELQAFKVGRSTPARVRDTRPIRIPVGALRAILEPIGGRMGR